MVQPAEPGPSEESPISQPIKLGPSEESPINQEFPGSPPVDINRAIEEGGCGCGTFLYCSGALLLQAAYGAEIVVLTVVGLILRCEWNLSTFWITMLQICSVATNAIFALLTAHWGDKYGRRTICLISAVGIVMSGMLCGLAQNFWQLVVMRSLGGVFIGIGLGPSVAITGEIPPVKYRSLSVSGISLCWGLGGFMASGMAYLTILPFGWRMYLIVVSVILLPSIILMAVVTESPRHDVRCGRVRKAEVTLKRMYRMNCRYSAELRLLEEEGRSASARSNRSSRQSRRDATEETEKITPLEGTPNCSQVITTNQAYKNLEQSDNLFYFFVMCFLNFFTYFAYYALTYAAPRLLNEGYCSNLPAREVDPCTFSNSTLFQLGVVSLCEPIGVLIAVFAVDKIGRRPTFFIYTVATLIVLSCLYICLGPVWLTFIIFLCKGVVAALSWSPFILSTEYFPTSVRSFTNSTGNSIKGVAATLAIFAVQFSYDYEPKLVIGTLQVMVVGSGICFWFLKRETRGIYLEQ